jgi:hypothetical protein
LLQMIVNCGFGCRAWLRSISARAGYDDPYRLGSEELR